MTREPTVSEVFPAFAAQDLDRMVRLFRGLYTRFAEDGGSLPVGPLMVQISTAMYQLFVRNWASRVMAIHPISGEPLFVLHACPEPATYTSQFRIAMRMVWLNGSSTQQWQREVSPNWHQFPTGGAISPRAVVDGFFYTRSAPVASYIPTIMAKAGSGYSQWFWLPWDGRRLLLTVDMSGGEFYRGEWREIFVPATGPKPGDVTMWTANDLNALYQDLGLFEMRDVDRLQDGVQRLAGWVYKQGFPPHKPKSYHDTAGLF